MDFGMRGGENPGTNPPGISRDYCTLFHLIFTTTL
jgi:hypothetical protein